jgi:hypothetical protein
MATKSTAKESAKSSKKTQAQNILKSNLPPVVFLSKVDKLNRLTTGKLAKPGFFGQKAKNPSSDSFDDQELEYDYTSIPGAVRNLTTQWDKINQKWAWYGTYNDLHRIGEALSLRDPKTGNIIMPEEKSLTNPSDPFLNHHDFFASTFMRGGKIALHADIPLEEFFIRTYMGNPEIKNPMLNQSSITVAGAELAIWSPQTETKIRKEKVEEEDSAIEFLRNMSVDRQLHIAQIMQPTSFDELTGDNELLYMELRDGCAKNTAKSSKFGGSTWQGRFLQLAQMKDAELHTMAQIIDAKSKRAFTRKEGVYHLGGLKLENTKNDNDLISYFMNPKNMDMWDKIVDFLENFEK